jgi:carbon storage regulator
MKPLGKEHRGPSAALIQRATDGEASGVVEVGRLNKESKMLCLTRGAGQQIVIGDNIVVTVLGITGDRVRLGLEAPSDVTLHRREIYDAIQEEAAGTHEGN